MRIAIAPWVADLRPATVAASLYALPPTDRVQGATAAHDAGCWVHVDVILRYREGAGFSSIGVTIDQLAAVVDTLPGAAVDVHLILLGDSPAGLRDRAVDEVGEQLVRLAPTRVSAAPPILDRIGPRLRSANPGVELWGELWPGLEWTGSTPVDGALVMLIQPGTKQHADPDRLAATAHLAGLHPVGVDGGISREAAGEARRLGVSYLVLGRSLFADATAVRRGHAE